MGPRRGALALVVALAGVACAPEGSGQDRTTTTLPASTTTLGPKPLLPPQEVPAHLSSMEVLWRTDFSKATIDLNELLVGLPGLDPRDLIPPIDDPVFEPVAESDWLNPQDPGVLVEMGEVTRFYPLRILTRHEIVNDDLGGVPVAVTYCPLCNTALAFERTLDGKTLRFGVSGLLRYSDLVMWDDATESLWQQITGEAIVGEHAGRNLRRVASAIVSWDDFRRAHPDGEVMTADQGFGRAYNHNPYAFYSSRDTPYAFYTGETDDRFPAMERVVGVSVGGVEKAYPFTDLSRVGVANDDPGGVPITVWWGSPATADALDSSDPALARPIGTAIAYFATVDGTALTFRAMGGDRFVDAETGTVWDLLGEALEGPLTGTRLELAPHRNEFWFAWSGFFPDGEVWEP